MTAGKRFKRLVRQRARRTGESYTSARRALLPSTTEDPMQDNELVELELLAVRMIGPDRLPSIAFQEKGGTSELGIFIGAPEASAIAFALNQQERPPRPMTHDALKQMVDAMGGQMTRVVLALVTEASTYTADVTVVLADGSERHFDWRPSDAVALAVRTEPPPAILAPRALLVAPSP